MKQPVSKFAFRASLTLTVCLISLLSLAGFARFTASGSSKSTGSTGAQTSKAQKSSPLAQPPSGQTPNIPTEARLDSFTATGYDGGSFIEWRTGFEVDNLGFRLYRERSGKRVLITPQWLAGSALVTGQGNPLTAGKPYMWWDNASTGKQLTSYWLEELNLSGQSIWHGPVFARFVGGPPPDVTVPAQLAALGQSNKPSRPVESRAKTARFVVGQSLSTVPLAGQAAVKITVNHEGWYRVTQSQLLAAGLNPNVDPRNLQLYVDGQPQAILVNGESDGHLDAADTVEFYGIGIDSTYTDKRVYWLTDVGTAGLRITAQTSPDAFTPDGSFPYTVERKDRTIYFSAVFNGETENFFGAVISSSPVPQSLNVTHLDATATNATLDVALQGVSFVQHQVSVSLNGTSLGSLSFFGTSQGLASYPVPPGLIHEGQNQVILSTNGVSGDLSLVDSLRLTYYHTYTADNDQLKMTVAANKSLTIGGFSSNAIRVYDITNPANVQEIIGQIQAQGGSFGVSLSAPGTGVRTLLALTGNQSQAASQVAANLPSSWSRPNQGADFVIVAPRSFFSAIDPLKAARQSQGLSVVVVDIEDVYDEFSYGQKTSQAIKDFLQLAHTGWKKPARYAMLVGDSSYDPKNYLGHGDLDFVPTKLIDTVFMEAASDAWLADFDDDGIEDMALGRLTPRTASETTTLVTKILSYDGMRRPDEMALAADSNDGYDFSSASHALHAVMPNNVRALDIDRGQMGDAAAKAALLDGIARGQRVVNYTGHGNIDQWRGNLLTNADAAAMTNRDRLPVFLLMTCMNGYFNDPALECMGEVLMKNSQGGAVAVWTSTGQTVPTGQWLINPEMYRQMYSAPGVRIGDAAKTAKQVTTDMDVRRTWVLLGDPTMRVR